MIEDAKAALGQGKKWHPKQNLYAHGHDGLRHKTPNTVRGVVIPQLSLPTVTSPRRPDTTGYGTEPSRAWKMRPGQYPGAPRTAEPLPRKGGRHAREAATAPAPPRPWDDVPDILVVEGDPDEASTSSKEGGEDAEEEDVDELMRRMDEEHFAHSTARFGTAPARTGAGGGLWYQGSPPHTARLRATGLRDAVSRDIQATLLRSKGIHRRLFHPVASQTSIDFLATPRRAVGDVGRTFGLERRPLAWAANKRAELQARHEDLEFEQQRQELKEIKKQIAINGFRRERKAQHVRAAAAAAEEAEVDRLFSRQVARRVAERGRECVGEYAEKRKKAMEAAARRRSQKGGGFGISANYNSRATLDRLSYLNRDA